MSRAGPWSVTLLRTMRTRTISTLVAMLLLAATASAAKLPWIEDDYAQALAKARAGNQPIFIEAWAPW